jgi:hypothetical protein
VEVLLVLDEPHWAAFFLKLLVKEVNGFEENCFDCCVAHYLALKERTVGYFK